MAARQGLFRTRAPIGVLLAGGDGRRMGGDKAQVGLAGRPLIHYGLDALTAELDDVVVACRSETELPPLPGVTEAWIESEGPHSPLRGIVCALRAAGNRAVVVFALPFALVTPAHVRGLVRADAAGRPAVMLSQQGRPQPLLARYGPTALPLLEGLNDHASLIQIVNLLRPTLVEVDPVDPVMLRVDVPEDLLRAQAALDARRRAVAHA